MNYSITTKDGQVLEVTEEIYEQFSIMKNRLLNAHQCVKNGVSLPWLKFDEFLLEMDKERDHLGNIDCIISTV